MNNSGSNIPIFCNQENFLLKANRFKINQCLPNSYIFFKPATKKGLEGRPKNGMFVAIPKKYRKSTTDVSPSSPRVQAILIRCNNRKLLVINSYFHQNTQNWENSLSDLTNILISIKEVINKTDFNDLIWTGDINADFGRSTVFTDLINSFINELDIQICWNKFSVDYTHANEMNDITYTSIIDHFFLSKTVSNSINNAGVLHLPENLSDHCPIYCKISGEINIDSEEIQNPCQTLNPKPSWKKASPMEKSNYSHTLDDKLKRLTVPLCITECRDVHCTDENHKTMCDKFMLDILQCIEKSAYDELPVNSRNVKNSYKKGIPRWNNDIEPFKENAHFWHGIWQSAGRPLNCQLHTIMKRTRNVYHLHIRKNRRMLDQIKKNDLLNCCIHGEENIFDKIRKSRKYHENLTTSIDGISGNDIPKHFAGIYKDLYNSVDDQEQLRIVEEDVQADINNTALDHIDDITADVLTMSSMKLKPGKSDPILEISSECLINGPKSLFEKFSLILKAYLVHGHVSDFLLLSSLQPMIKDKLGDYSVSSNYRSIAISSLVMKLFDWVVILLYGDRLQLHDLQFSYQEHVSTSMCTWMIVETIEYFLRNKSDVYACTMDMSKAFDRGKHSALFEKLRLVSIPPVIIRFLMSIYRLQVANVRWNGAVSNHFKIRNGVKQGAVLSAILYCVYMNDLFNIMKRKRYGCWINGEYYGLIGYADTLFLLAPSESALQEMLRTCETYANDFNLIFSTDTNPNKSKTKCIAFLQQRRELKKPKLCGNMLPWVDSVKHLGNTIENKTNGILSQDIRVKRAQFIQRCNEIIQELYFAHPRTKLQINCIYNTHFTGSVIWNLFSKEFTMIENTWNVSIRKIFNLHRETHRYFIEPVSGVAHIRFALFKRFLKFTTSLANSSKLSVTNLFMTLKRDTSSTTGMNLYHAPRKEG